MIFINAKKLIEKDKKSNLNQCNEDRRQFRWHWTSGCFEDHHGIKDHGVHSGSLLEKHHSEGCDHGLLVDRNFCHFKDVGLPAGTRVRRHLQFVQFLFRIVIFSSQRRQRHSGILLSVLTLDVYDRLLKDN